jgi:Lectin C-type domain
MGNVVISPTIPTADSSGRSSDARICLGRWALLVLAAGAPACVPLEELGGYSAGGGTSMASDPRPGATAPPLELDASGGVSPTARGRADADGLPSAETELEQPQPVGASSAQQGTDPDCGGACELEDSGVLAVAAPVPDAAAPLPVVCAPDETTGPNGRCYVVVATPLAWQAARANCQARGAGWDLASIRSSAESELLRSLLTYEAWVGGSDAAIEGTWTWVDDGFEFWQGDGVSGSPLNAAFLAWFADEPNGRETSDCMRLLLDPFWADFECTESLGSVCEGPPG